MKPTANNFKKNTLRSQIGSRGGGIEIDLTSFGFEGEKMTAYQNYLGGGMLGRICSDNTFVHKHSFIEQSIVQELEEIAEALKQYFHSLTNPEGEWESVTYEQNQKLPKSAY